MRLITLLDCLAVMVMEEINILPRHRLSRMASALGLEKAFAKAADPRTSSLEGALISQVAEKESYLLPRYHSYYVLGLGFESVSDSKNPWLVPRIFDGV